MMTGLGGSYAALPKDAIQQAAVEVMEEDDGGGG
jgi:hypothetical protein